jgi:hypothetical protein
MRAGLSGAGSGVVLVLLSAVEPTQQAEVVELWIVALAKRRRLAGVIGARNRPTRMSYTLLADLATATEKARRDAPAIAVSDLVE